MIRNALTTALVCIAGIGFIAVFTYLLVPLKVTHRGISAVKHRKWFIGTAVALLAVLASTASALPASFSSSHHSSAQFASIKFIYPGHLAPGEPDWQVPCKLTVRGTGVVPAGYSLAVGEQHIADTSGSGDPEIDYESSVQQDAANKTWTANVTLGNTGNHISDHYQISVITMSENLESYIEGAVNWQDDKSTWWPSASPPPTARILDSVTVEQATNCPKNNNK